MVDNPDTIVAIATPPGRGGIGIVRLSGSDAAEIGQKVVGKELWPRYAHFSKFHDRDGATIDEGIAVYFPAPGSYTGEDVVELHAHGSRMALDMLVERAVELGARPARPGEFTERAFHNNRIDLLQAEAVADLIDSVSARAARSAVRSLEGKFSGEINKLLDSIITLRTRVEGSLDFPDEDAAFFSGEELSGNLESCLAALKKIFAAARQGAILNEGIIAVIAGRPNVGKSTLLNALAGREAAIVTEIPGTTRDLIEQDIVLDGIPVHIIDTAGLRATKNRIEKEGIRRATAAAEAADILIMIKEYGQPLSVEESSFLERAVSGRHALLLHNKIDLFGAEAGIAKKDQRFAEINISAKTGAGLAMLTGQLREFLGMQHMPEDLFIARRRHIDALERTRQSLQAALAAHAAKSGMELLAEHLRLAQHALGEITGIYAADDLLGEIFSRFCLGK